MTLPGSGAISTADIVAELGLPAGTVITLTETQVRDLAQKSVGAIVLPNDFWGKAVFIGSSSTPSTSGCSFGGGTSCSTTTGTATVTSSGGVAPLTYLWEHVSGDTATVNTPTASSTTFSRTYGLTSTNTLQVRTGSYRCKITDNIGRIVYTNSVTVTTNHTYTGVPI